MWRILAPVMHLETYDILSRQIHTRVYEEVFAVPYVRTVPYHEAQGELKAMYDQSLHARGRVDNVMSINSLRPHLMKTLSAHSSSVLNSESGLTPAERQMVATVVSAINKCQY